ncbi:MAG: hypothetical protein GXP24_11820 [Planctomycetes bacterium]|nr:hypothetical protein [Planctomycetota bacterium]
MSSMLRLFAQVFLVAFCILTQFGHAKPLDGGRKVFRFDAGPKDSFVEEGSAALYPLSAYTPESGIGWTQSPTRGFERLGWSRSRNALTIDGVAGKRLALRADVAPGDWQVRVWLESARTDTTPIRVIIQGKEMKLGWQTFTAPAEPKRSPSKTYRVFQAATHVGSDGLSLELSRAEQEVRLLGISLIRHVPERNRWQRNLLEQFASAGSFRCDDSLAELSAQLADRSDPFHELWRERLELLQAAERLFKQRGWEWANEETGLGMFDRLYQAVMLVDGLLGPDADLAQPFAERATYLRGRILYWLDREIGGKFERAGANRDLGRLYAKHPHDDVLAMYMGQKIDLPDACDCLKAKPDAPAWAVAQREALCRMRQIAHWWVQQQSDSGEFGGKLGDDVELLRWWAPLVLAGDQTVLAGWEKLANGVWQSKHVHEGYAAKLSDVEHAAEFVADTAPLMAVYSDDAIYLERLAWSAKHFQNLWTGTTPQGHRFFRSAWFNSTAIEEQEPKGRDLEYNTRAVQPMRYLAWRRPNPEVVELLHQWSLAWVSAAMRTEKGKPRGLIPASVRFADESINGDEPTWHLPNMYWKYYEWENNVGSLMLDQLLFTYSQTHDDRLNQPMRLTLDLIRAEEANLLHKNQDTSQAGSQTWAAAKLIRSEKFWNVVEQWRFLTGESRWDALILRHGTPYGRYRLSGEQRHLVEGLNPLLEGVRYNTPLMTTEAIHTDRVYVPRAELLKAMLTGDSVKDNVSPYYAVSWEETDENFTALVSDTGPDRLTAKLYSHSPEERHIVMRIWQLTPGKYQLRQEPQSQGIRQQHSQEWTIRVLSKGERIPISLPGQREIVISITQKRE